MARGRRGGSVVASAAVLLMVGVSPTSASRSVSVGAGVSGTTTRVSVSSAGVQGNDHSGFPVLSAGGRFAAFTSRATNLVPGDSNGVEDVFVRDRRTGTTRRMSVSSTGSQANGDSGGASISAGGRFVAFGSSASNLVPGDTNNATDTFVRDRWTGTTRRVSVSSTGAQGNGDSRGPSISAGGRFVAFTSRATNLVPGDTTDWEDIFVRDRLTGTTTQVSVSSTGAQANSFNDNPSISADGRFVAFLSVASNLVPGDTNDSSIDIFLRDRRTGTTRQVSVSSAGAQGNGDSFGPTVSAGGRFVAFYSYASNLVPGDTNTTFDSFVRDRWTGATRRVSVSSTGAQGNSFSVGASISENGRVVAFTSAATNLVPGDTNNSEDVFVHYQ
jgi:hypothetical protein